MDEEAVRAVLKHYLDSSDQDIAHEIYHEDAVLEFPQSGERFEGVENFREWRRIYPANVEYETRRMRGRDDLWIVEILARYDGGPWNYGVSILEVRATRWRTRQSTAGRRWEAPAWRAAPPREPGGEPVSEPAAGAGGA